MKRVVFHGPRWLVAATLMGATGSSFLAPPRAAWAQSFKLGPDDVIAVQVANHPEMSTPETSVGANGKVALPLVGNLTVGGLTLAQTQAAIRQALRKQLRAPQVTVSLVRSRPRQVITLGAVVRPGPIDVQPGARVSEVLAAVGGLTVPAEQVTATLTRTKMAPMPLKLAAIASSPESSANVRLRAGDVINVVPKAVSRVTVSGDVVTPSLVTLHNAPRVFDAIMAAGGLKERKPEEMRGTLLRNSSTIKLDLPTIFSDRASAANVALKDGDLLSLETVRTNVTVFSVDNLVKVPGTYEFGTEATAVGALVKAGGLTVPADNVVASIRRGAQVMPINLERAVYDPSKDMRMIEGDVLLLSYPEGPQITLTGAVARPGPLRVKQGTTLIDAVVAAGGLTFKPDQVRLSILRTMPDGKQITLAIDPVALWDLRDLGQNVRMQQGDLVIINQGAVSQTVFVSGEVATPGAFEINPKDSLPEVILRAGGPTKLASLSQVTVTRRDGSTQMVDVSAALGSNAPKLEFPLQQGDIVVVPPNKNVVLVMNAVTVPGYYPIPENGTLTVGDAILAAGGSRVGAKLKEVAILHRNPDGTVDKRIVSLADVKNGSLNIDTPLRAGDVVYVPEGKMGPGSFQQAGQVLGTLGGILRFGSIF
jgi:polysaccharide export outer membrane protein